MTSFALHGVMKDFIQCPSFMENFIKWWAWGLCWMPYKMRLALLGMHRPAAGGLSPSQVQAAGQRLLRPSWSANCPVPHPVAPSPLGLWSTGGPLIFRPLLTDPRVAVRTLGCHAFCTGSWDLSALSASAPPWPQLETSWCPSEPPRGTPHPWPSRHIRAEAWDLLRIWPAVDQAMTLLMVHKVLEQTSVPTYCKHPGCREGAGHLAPTGLPRAEFWPPSLSQQASTHRWSQPAGRGGCACNHRTEGSAPLKKAKEEEVDLESPLNLRAGPWGLTAAAPPVETARPLHGCTTVVSLRCWVSTKRDENALKPGETEDGKRKTVNGGRLRKNWGRSRGGRRTHRQTSHRSQGHTQQEERQNRTEDSWSKTQIQTGEN